MSDPFSPEQIEQMTNEINGQLRNLTVAADAAEKASGGLRARPVKQLAAIQQATGEDPTTFLTRFRHAARQDLCEKGGLLHAQWEKYRDLASKDMLKTFGGILIGLGLSGSALASVGVAVSVYVLYLGVQAFCAGED